jgi:hypothetical protein
MPFTVSHAAAFLPFRKLNLIWSAFIVGSMAPDFPYVIGNTNYRDLGHHMPGLLKFTLPASIVALWLFHNVLKGPVIGLMPVEVQERLRSHAGDFQFGGIGRFMAIMGSILLGIATHLLWDAFTHGHTWAWYRFACLRTWVTVPLLHNGMPMYAVLQYISSIAGLLALAAWVVAWYRSSTPAPVAPRVRKSRFALAIGMFAFAAMAGLARAVIMTSTPGIPERGDKFLLECGVTSLAVAFWQILLYCVLVSTRQVW